MPGNKKPKRKHFFRRRKRSKNDEISARLSKEELPEQSNEVAGSEESDQEIRSCPRSPSLDSWRIMLESSSCTNEEEKNVSRPLDACQNDSKYSNAVYVDWTRGEAIPKIDVIVTPAGSTEVHVDTTSTCDNETVTCPTVDAELSPTTISPKQIDECNLVTNDTPRLAIAPCPRSADLTKMVNSRMPTRWICVESADELHISMLSIATPPLIQRTITYNIKSGRISISTHGIELPADHSVFSFLPIVPSLSDETVNLVVDLLCNTVCQVRRFEICIGANTEELSPLWKKTPNVSIDENNFKEIRYNRCCRSNQCLMLVPVRSHRCCHCTSLIKVLRKRFIRNKNNPKGTPVKFKADKHLSTPETKARAKRRVKRNRNLQNQLNRLRERMNVLIKDEGVDIDKSLNDDLSKILEKSKLTDFQKVFFQQCSNNASAKSPSGRRWHPAVIKFALDIHLHSPSAYNVFKRYLVLPSERTLFDYSHVQIGKEGLCLSTIEEIGRKLSDMHNYQSLHVIAFDEVYVSQNLVYKKHTGEMVGYCHLSDVEKELRELEQVLESAESNSVINDTPPLASRILSFMVNGVSSGLSEIVASYCTHSLDADTLYHKHWEVVEALECAGVQVLGSIGDGCSVNRAFILKHPPLTSTKSGITFDTVNPYGECRPFYFFSDPPHLLKTIRNCVASTKRNLRKNNKDIKWSHIIRLYNETKDQTLRKAYHLNADSVFLTSYSRMSVSHAARVMSTTVANALRQTGWDDVDETANLLEKVHQFFHCLNGNYSFEAARKRDDDLKPYRDKDDPRFKWLEEFLCYLEDWANEVKHLPIPGEKKEKMLLSRQTLQGIEITVRSFIGAVQFSLDAGTKFVMARVFCQDLLEHYFGRQRGKCGGSNNPNTEEFFRHQNIFKVLGAVGAKRKRSNVDVGDSGPSVDSTPLPKRRKQSKRSLF